MVEFLQYSFCFMVVISLAMRHMGSSLPNQGLKPYTTTRPPAPPALQGEVLTPGPPVKSLETSYFMNTYRASLVAQW